MKINNVVIATTQEQPEGFQGVSFNEAGLNNIIKNNDKEPVDIKDIETQEVIGSASILLKDKKIIADIGSIHDYILAFPAGITMDQRGYVIFADSGFPAQQYRFLFQGIFHHLLPDKFKSVAFAGKPGIIGFIHSLDNKLLQKLP